MKLLILVLLLCSLVEGLPARFKQMPFTSSTEPITRPRYPDQFVSNWTYELTSPQGIIVAGWTIMAGANQSLYYYMSAFGGWEQLLTGTIEYNFCRSTQTCCFNDYGWPIYTQYFQNATLVGPLPLVVAPSAPFTGLLPDPASEVVEWVGSLNAQLVYQADITYFVRTNRKTGYLLMYISANVVDQIQSEIMNLIDMQLVAGPTLWFTIPSFCKNSLPCSEEPSSGC